MSHLCNLMFSNRHIKNRVKRLNSNVLLNPIYLNIISTYNRYKILMRFHFFHSMESGLYLTHTTLLNLDAKFS